MRGISHPEFKTLNHHGYSNLPPPYTAAARTKERVGANLPELLRVRL